MKEVEYNRLKAEIPDFDKKYVRLIKLKDIIIDPHNSQVRKNGHELKKAKKLAGEIKDGGQRVPVSGRMDSLGRPVLGDGATRYFANKHLGNEEIPMSFYHDQQKLPDWAYYDFQCQSNQHGTTTNNTSPDIKRQIQERYDKGYIDQVLGFRYQDNPEEWIKRSCEYIRGVYGKSSLPEARCLKYIESALGGKVTEKFESWDKTTSMNKFHNQRKNLGINWNPTSKGAKRVGEVDNGLVFYNASTQGQLRSNFTGFSVWKSKANKGVKCGVVCWKDELLGATPEAIYDFYEAMIEDYNWLSKNVCVDGEYVFNGGLYALPQIKTGEHAQNMDEVINLLEWKRPEK